MTTLTFTEDEDYFSNKNQEYLHTPARSPIEIPPKRFHPDEMGKRIKTIIARKEVNEEGVAKADLQIADLPMDDDSEDSASSEENDPKEKKQKKSEEKKSSEEKEPETGGMSSVTDFSYKAYGNVQKKE